MNSLRADDLRKEQFVSKDLKAMFGFKPLKADRKVLVVSLEDMDPTEFHSMREATRDIGIGEGVIRYARNNGRDFLRNSRAKTSRCFS